LVSWNKLTVGCCRTDEPSLILNTTCSVINYSGTLNASGNVYLSVYGWTTNPFVEYYVVEHWGTVEPGWQTGLKPVGTLTSDGATYSTFQIVRYNHIDGSVTLRQFWSVRQTKRTSGTVSFANHTDAWAKAGLSLGTHNYQVVAVEGYGGSGSASVTVD